MTIDFESLEENSKQFVAAAMKAGADHCDVVVANGQSRGISVRDGKIENTSSSQGDGFSLRVFVENKVATVSTNQIADLQMMAERAVAMAKVAPQDPFQGLADGPTYDANDKSLELLDPSIPSVEELTTSAMSAEAAGLNVSGVSKSMGASAGWGISGFVLATSNGFSGSYARSGSSCSAAMLSGSGETMERDYDFTSAVFREDLRPPEEIGASAGERAVRRANPRQIESGAVPIIFDKRISGGLLGALLGAINGASVARKTSFLRELMGEKVTSEQINIHDDPLINRGLGSKPFDGEGLACKPLCLVENGILQEWLLDSAAARELGLKTNARAIRGGGGTSPSSSNAWIEAGQRSLEEITSEIQNGFYCTETIGHGINMVTGDYSKGATGFWIENGEISYPVSEITIAGNLKDMFLNMEPLNDLEFKGSVNAPSMLVTGMMIGGK